MTSVRFISKAQFEGVYSHFQQVEKDANISIEEIQIEYRLLLGYFRSLYEDSKRKIDKIMHLTSEVANYKKKIEEVKDQYEKDVVELEQKLAETKITLDKQRKTQLELIQLNDELREKKFDLEAAQSNDVKQSQSVIKSNDVKQSQSAMKSNDVKQSQSAMKSNDVKQSQSAIYINRRPTILPKNRTRFSQIAVGSSKILQSSRSFRIEKDVKKEQDDECSMAQEMKLMKKKYEDEIGRLQNQVKIISAEAKLFHSEADKLKDYIEYKDRHFSEYKNKLSKEKELEKREREILKIKNSSLQTMVDNFVNDLKLVKDEKQLQQEDFKNSMEERHALLLQIREKNKYIENLKSNIDSLTKTKQSAVKKACVFEENLSMDREQLTMAKKNVDALNRTIDGLETNLREKESRLNQQEDRRKRLEASQKSELLEQTKMIEYYKGRLASHDKRIKSLTTELEQTNEKLASVRRQLRGKKRENAMLSEEFQKWKTNLGINTENMKSLKTKLDCAETSKSELQSELKSTKSQYVSMLKERNKLLAQCKQLDSVIEYREIENDLLSNRQNYLRNNLIMKDAQMEKIAKLRRLSWAK